LASRYVAERQMSFCGLSHGLFFLDPEDRQ